MRIEGTFLRSAVGRRIFALFLFASTLPVALLALLTYQGVADLLERSAGAEMTGYSKSYGMGVIGRLRVAQDRLAQLDTAGLAALEAVGDAGRPQVFRALATVVDSGAVTPLWTDRTASRQSLAALGARVAAPASIAGDAAVIPLPDVEADAPLLAMIRKPSRTAEARPRLLGVLLPGYLFGDEQSLPATTDVCVFEQSGRQPLFCSNPNLSVLAQALAQGRQPQAAPAPHFDSGVWTLPAASHLTLSAWTFVAMRPIDSAALAERGLGATYVKVALVCLVLVLLLSLTQIRRVLVPLERLIEATRRVAAWDFSRPVPVDRQDEFGQLAASFNGMAQNLESQIGVLRTLSAIDQDILSHQDPERIIGRVLLRLRLLVPGSIAAVARVGAGTDARAQAAAWIGTAADGDHAGERLVIMAGEVEATPPDGRKVQNIDGRDDPAAGALCKALFDRGARRCVIASGRNTGGARTLLALGLPLDRALDGPGQVHLQELANRTGVAFDASDWQRKLVDEARSDSLTGLPNRLRLHEIIEERLGQGGRGEAMAGAAASKLAAPPPDPPFALLFIDLDRFKGVNDGLGHDAGDALLVQAARRLRDCVQGDDVVARLGGDEFIVLTAQDGTQRNVGTLADDIIGALSAPYRIGHAVVHVSASIGIASSSKDGSTREDLIRCADTALYQAKAQGRGRAVHFQEAMRKVAVETLALEEDLRAALGQGDIGVHFQPRVRLSDRRLVGAEALARWRHATRGAVSPVEFVELAEEVGLIDALTDSVLKQTCAFLAARTGDAGVVCPVSVNLSAGQLRDPDLAPRLKGIVESYGLKPHDIELEITEGVMVDDRYASARALERLRKKGFRIALDDFGTGYSSLSYLKDLPIDVMKIDRSFVKDLETSPGSRAIAVAIVGIAKTLGLRVVAEGIETEEQAAMLRDWGCEEGQGYLFAKPLAAADFDRFIQENQREPAATA